MSGIWGSHRWWIQPGSPCSCTHRPRLRPRLKPGCTNEQHAWPKQLSCTSAHIHPDLGVDLYHSKDMALPVTTEAPGTQGDQLLFVLLLSLLFIKQFLDSGQWREKHHICFYKWSFLHNWIKQWGKSIFWWRT